MTVFVGGPLHGHSLDVELTAAPAGPEDYRLPAEFVHLPTGFKYALYPVNFDLPGPSGVIRHSHGVYVDPKFTRVPPQEFQNLLAGAVLIYWFVAYGHKTSPTDPLANGNLAPEPDVSYRATCDCGEDGTFTMLGRAQWMQKHIDLGHQPKALSEQDTQRG